MNWGWLGLFKRALEFADGEASEVSPAGRGRLRYNDGTKQFEISEDGGAYSPIGEVGEGGWTDDGAIVRLTTASDTVAVGAAAMVGAEKFRVVGGVRVGGDIDFDSGAQRNVTIDQAADDTNGDGLVLTAGTAGNATVSLGKQGGRFWARAGSGTDGVSGSNGGLGGLAEMWAGTGGGGIGGGDGGNGGALHAYAGGGANASDAGDGGTGGEAAVQGGTGGQATGTGTSGPGGDVLCRGGGGGAGAAGGDARIEGGLGTPRGEVRVGGASTSRVQIGNVTDNPDLDILGSGNVSISGTLTVNASAPAGSEKLRVEGDILIGTSAALTMVESAGDPGGTANVGKLYTKDVLGVTELFYQRSDGTVAQLS